MAPKKNKKQKKNTHTETLSSLPRKLCANSLDLGRERNSTMWHTQGKYYVRGYCVGVAWWQDGMVGQWHCGCVADWETETAIPWPSLSIAFSKSRNAEKPAVIFRNR